MRDEFVFSENWVNDKVETLSEQKKKLQLMENRMNIIRQTTSTLDARKIVKIENDIRELIHSYTKTSDSLQQFKDSIISLSLKLEGEVDDARISSTKLFS